LASRLIARQTQAGAPAVPLAVGLSLPLVAFGQSPNPSGFTPAPIGGIMGHAAGHQPPAEDHVR